ncbi:MAG: hypothetical protein Q9225_007442, partial [Loekoesia sp. 1 TL-2023]
MEYKEYTTELTESTFLKDLGFDLNPTHDLQLYSIHHRGQAHIEKYKKLQSQLHSQFRNTFRYSDIEDNMHAISFCKEIQKLLQKSSVHIATLQEMTERAWQQRCQVLDNLFQQYIPPVTAPAPVEVESVFRPGQQVTIIWQGYEAERVRDIDELSTTADDGDESVSSGYKSGESHDDAAKLEN